MAKNILGPGSEFRHETIRLASYKCWPPWAEASPTILASSGFYYQNYKDEVICFSCGGRIRGWKCGENPKTEHMRHFPRCKFINGTDNQNITSETEFNVPPNYVTNGFTGDSQYSTSNSNSNTSTFEGRLATFNGWPRWSTIQPYELATAGFTYTGIDDIAECFMCNGKIRRWQPGDTALGEHVRLYPNCPFLLTFDNEQLMLNTSSPHRHNITTSSNVRAATNRTQDNDDDDDDPIVTERPKIPQYAIETKRTDSYKNWPRDKTQTPSQLSEAGFFYAGFNDNVKCFYCGGGLRNWEEHDVPWEEHARWFPKCGWVKQCKGLAYIKQFSNKKKNKHVTKETETRNGYINIEAVLDYPACKAVENMGYSRELIEKTLKKNFIRNNTITKSFTAGELIDVLFEVEEEMKRNLGTEEKEATSSACESTEEFPEVEPNSSTGSLKRENEKLKEKSLCKICFERTNEVLLLPCAHLCCCEVCAPNLKKCPVCKTIIKKTVRTYMS